MSEALKNQRTYALVGSGGCGKTSVAEMILSTAGVVSRLGKIEEGTTVLDYEPEEIKRRGSIQPGFATYKWNKNTHFLIDTPGDGNFNGDLPYLLAAADATVFVIDAVDGVKPLSKKAWNDVKKAGIPSIIFINKMDRDRADFGMALTSIREVLGAKPVLMYMPIGEREGFKGVVDMFSGQAFLFDGKGGVTKGEAPADVAEEAALQRQAMIENIAESDEALMEKYLESGELDPEEIKAALSQGVKSGELVPILVGSGLQNMGGALLLDAIQALLPSPLDHAPLKGEDANERASSPTEPLSCFVFKTLADPFAGQLTVVRVLSGTLSPDSTVLNSGRDEKERIGGLLFMQGKEQIASKEPQGPGAIVTLAKLKVTRTGDTLCDEKAKFVFRKPELPNQLITYALAPKEKGDEDKVYAAVAKLLDEDVTLFLSRDEETGDTLLSGMGQNHIEIAVERAKRRYKVDIILKTPKVPYRETLKAPPRKSRAATRSRPAAAASSATAGSTWSPCRATPATSSRTPSWAAPSPASSSRPWTRASRSPWCAAIWPGIP